MSNIPTSTTPHGESSNLDLLRTVAVLSVYLFHLLFTLGYTYVPTSDSPPDWTWFIGRFGVLVFFVHTSLVLMMSLERTDRSGQSMFWGFYTRRAFRIYPLSMACVAIVAYFHLPQNSHVAWFDPDWKTITANLFLVQNLLYRPNVISVLWSLPVEVQMYVMLPFLYLIGRRFKMPGLIAVWIAAIVASYIQPHIAGRLTVARYVPCFLAGVACYFVGFGRVRRRLPFLLWPVTIAAAAAIFVFFGDGDRSEVAWLVCAMLGLSAPFFIETKARWLKSSSMLIARYSFGIYLTHMYALWAAFIVLKNQLAVVRWSLLVVLSVALPVLFYHLLEEPMIKVGARLAKKIPGPSVRDPEFDGAVLSRTLFGSLSGSELVVADMDREHKAGSRPDASNLRIGDTGDPTLNEYEIRNR